MKKRVLSFLLVFVIIIFSSISFSATKQEQLDAKKKEIEKTKTQMNQNKSEQKSVLSDINTIDTNINTTEKKVNDIKNEISFLEKDIEKTQEDIEVTQADYDKKYELRKSRMIAYYKNGNVSMQELSNEASDETEKLYMERVIDKIVTYDTSLVNELERMKIDLEEKKAKLEDSKAQMQVLKKEYESQLSILESKKSTKEKYLTTLKTDYKQLEASVDKMNQEADKLTKEIQAAASKSSNSKYMGGTMTWPLPGFYYITSPFGNRLHPILKTYKLHTGVDIAGSGCNGSKVVAAADGKVITAKYNTAYGNYVVIDHGGGITTLYAHSSKLVVSAGQQVKAGQEIMKVGTTGYSTGPHLHFEVRENGNYVNPLNGYISAK